MKHFFEKKKNKKKEKKKRRTRKKNKKKEGKNKNKKQKKHKAKNTAQWKKSYFALMMSLHINNLFRSEAVKSTSPDTENHDKKWLRKIV